MRRGALRAIERAALLLMLMRRARALCRDAQRCSIFNADDVTDKHIEVIKKKNTRRARRERAQRAAAMLTARRARCERDICRHQPLCAMKSARRVARRLRACRAAGAQ